MKNIDLNLIAERLKRNNESIEKWNILRNEYPPNSDNYSNFTEDLGSYYYDAGLKLILLGPSENAIEYFIRACDLFEECSQNPLSQGAQEIGRVIHREWIEAAIFSKNKARRKQCAEKILSLIKLHGDIHPAYYESLIISYYILNDLKNMNKNIPILQKHEEMMVKSRNFAAEGKFIGLAKMMSGILKNDSRIFIEGCTAALNNFSRLYRDPTPPLCTEAYKYLVLAEEQGMRFKKEDFPKRTIKYIFRYFEE
jgi:tetratricopeptide (TPR) repeat protein